MEWDERGRPPIHPITPYPLHVEVLEVLAGVLKRQAEILSLLKEVSERLKRIEEEVRSIKEALSRG